MKRQPFCRKKTASRRRSSISSPSRLWTTKPFVGSVKKTGRAVVVHEAPRSFGPGAEVVSRIMEKAFYYLEAPIARVTGYDVMIPLFSRENAYLPNAGRIVAGR